MHDRRARQLPQAYTGQLKVSLPCSAMPFMAEIMAKMVPAVAERQATAHVRSMCLGEQGSHRSGTETAPCSSGTGSSPRGASG